MSSEDLVPVSTLPTPDDFQTERRQRRAMILHERNDGSNHDIKKKKKRGKAVGGRRTITLEY